MSGHSKWSKVKHQKAVTDVVKAKAFTKASRAVTIAVREGGGLSDPADNFKLRLAIEKAKEVNMPKENIERAVAKGKGEGGEVIESLLYEGYGPSGSAFLIQAATENKQRTVSSIKNALEHHNGSLAAPGSVLYQFLHRAVIIILRPQQYTDDEIFSFVVDSGAIDVEFYEDSIEVTSEVAHAELLKRVLESKNIAIKELEFTYIPTIPLELDTQLITSVEELSDILMELDDVLTVYTNVL